MEEVVERTRDRVEVDEGTAAESEEFEGDEVLVERDEGSLLREEV